MRLSSSRLIETTTAIFKKDFLVSLREPAKWATMLMFGLTSTAILSMSIGIGEVDASLAAALLWTIIFFAASSGMAGTFESEAESGTLATLKLYAPAQAILFGKILFVIASLALLTIFLVPIFLILFDCSVAKIWLLAATIPAGIIGLATAGTLIAALTVSASVKGGLFQILLFPIVLPIFFPAIRLTESAFQNFESEANLLVVMIFYDAILLVATSILYDYIE